MTKTNKTKTSRHYLVMVLMPTLDTFGFIDSKGKLIENVQSISEMLMDLPLALTVAKQFIATKFSDLYDGGVDEEVDDQVYVVKLSHCLIPVFPSAEIIKDNCIKVKEI